MGKKSRKKKPPSPANKNKPGQVWRRSGTLTAVVVIILLGVALIALISARQDSGTTGAKNPGGGDQSSAKDSIEMTDVKATIANGSITVSEDEVRKAGIVYFEYKGTKNVSLLAYVGPSGKIFSAVSLCEPCRGQRFHIEGKTLVCNTCGSVWELETHTAVSGACTNYPPEIIPSTTQNGLVTIPETEVKSWQPRA